MKSPLSFPTVEAWVDEEYGVHFGEAGHLSAKTLSVRGKIVRAVHPQSPAALLGLKAGDILFYVNGGVFTDEDVVRTYKPKRFLRFHKFDFMRLSSRQHIRIVGRTFPFGIQLGDTVGGFIRALRNLDPDPQDIEQFWTNGDEEDLGALWPSMEAYHIRVRDLKGAPFDGQLPRSVDANSPLVSEDKLWPGVLTWMALCAAHASQYDRARFILDYVEDYFERSGDSGMMSMFAAMATVRSMIAEHDKDRDLAIAYMHHAIETSPNIRVLYSRLSRLTETHIDPPGSAFIGVKPVYDLPRFDPSGRFSQPKGQVSLRDTVKTLQPGEFMLVTVMSRYRVNGPYVAGFQRALMPLSYLRDFFKEVHIVTSWDKSQSRDLLFPIMENHLRRKGVSVSVLFDENDAVSTQLSMTSAPTNLILDHNGLVVSEGWLIDDKLLWKALETLS